MQISLFEKYRSLLFERYSILPNHFDDGFNDWIEKRGSYKNCQADYIWSILNILISILAKNAESENELYQKQKDVYCIQLELLIDEGEYNRSRMNSVKRQILRMDLLQSDLFAYLQEAEFICNGCCNECLLFDGKKISLSEALKTLPIPIKECKREYGCNCSMATIAIRDQDGRLIKKE